MKPRRRFQVFYQNVGGQAMLVKQNLFFEVSDGGIEIWRLLDGKHTVDNILSRLGEKYGFLPEEERETVESFLEYLRANDLITYIGGTGNEQKHETEGDVGGSQQADSRVGRT